MLFSLFFSFTLGFTPILHKTPQLVLPINFPLAQKANLFIIYLFIYQSKRMWLCPLPLVISGIKLFGLQHYFTLHTSQSHIWRQARCLKIVSSKFGCANGYARWSWKPNNKQTKFAQAVSEDIPNKTCTQANTIRFEGVTNIEGIFV